MGFRLRKTIKAGPFRATISKSGVSYSAGVGPARVTRRANGRVTGSVNLPGPVSYETTLSGATRNPRHAAQARGSRGGAGTAESARERQQIVDDAARMLREGMKPRQVDGELRRLGLGFMARGEVLRDAKKLNKRLRRGA